jgi:hypothetical protein
MQQLAVVQESSKFMFQKLFFLLGCVTFYRLSNASWKVLFPPHLLIGRVMFCKDNSFGI